MEESSEDFERYVKLAIGELKKKRCSKAEEDIKSAMGLNPHSPKVHNLYGILEELQWNRDLARKHYRAAYALDPTYQPPIRNLERIGLMEYRNDSSWDYGDGAYTHHDFPAPAERHVNSVASQTNLI